MNEMLIFSENKNDSIKIDFTDITSMAQLQQRLTNAVGSKNYSVNTSATFNTDTGISLRLGSGNTDNNNSITTWIQNTTLITLNNYPIPKKVRFKAHVTQTKDARHFSSLAIKTSSMFNLLYYVDRGKAIDTATGRGLFQDGYTPTLQTANNMGKNLMPLSTTRQNIDVTLDVTPTEFPNFYSFIGNTKTCNIIWQQMLRFRDKDLNQINYPMYLERLEFYF